MSLSFLMSTGATLAAQAEEANVAKSPRTRTAASVREDAPEARSISWLLRAAGGFRSVALCCVAALRSRAGARDPLVAKGSVAQMQRHPGGGSRPGVIWEKLQRPKDKFQRSTEREANVQVPTNVWK